MNDAPLRGGRSWGWWAGLRWLGLVLVIDLLILGALWLRRDPLPQAPPVELLAAVDEPRSEPATPDPESDRLLAAVLGGGEDAEEAWQRLRTGDEPWVPAARARLAAATTATTAGTTTARKSSRTARPVPGWPSRTAGGVQGLRLLLEGAGAAVWRSGSGAGALGRVVTSARSSSCLGGLINCAFLPVLTSEVTPLSA